MSDIIGLSDGNALQTREITSKIRKLLADSGKYYVSAYLYLPFCSRPESIVWCGYIEND